MKTNIKKVLLCLVIFLNTFTSTSFAIPVPDGDGNSPAWIVRFFASSYFAKVGKPVPVQWQSLFSVGCSLWTNQTGGRVIPTSGSTTVTPVSSSSMTIRLTCIGTNGRPTVQYRSFNVNRADHPELNTLSVNRSSGEPGTEVTLTWASAFSNSCELTGTHSRNLGPSGSRQFTLRQGSNTFSMVCRSNDGRLSNQKTVTVLGQSSLPRILQLVTAETSGFYRVIWSADADFCDLDGFAVLTSGSRSFPNQGFAVLHRLTCTKNRRTISQTVWFRPSTGFKG